MTVNEARNKVAEILEPFLLCECTWAWIEQGGQYENVVFKASAYVLTLAKVYAMIDQALEDSGVSCLVDKTESGSFIIALVKDK